MNKKIVIIGSILIAVILVLIFLVLLFPKIELKGKNIINITYPNKYVEEGYKVNSLFKGLDNNVSIKSNLDETHIGTYKIEYTIPFLIFKISKYRTVNIIDDKAPILSLNENIKQTICPNATYLEEGYEAFDNYDGDITLNVKSTKISDGLLYEILDSSGNITTAKRTIIEEDTISPTININGSNPKNIYVGSTYNDEGATASDNCDSDLTDKISTQNNVDVSTLGTYEVKYTVEDSSGNIAEAIRTVKVINKTNYGNSTIYLTFDDGPSENITPKILDILKEEGVKATFFVINHDDSLNYIIKRAYDEGHTIALHTASHNYAKIYASEEAFFTDLDIIREKVKKITGEYSNIIRFPGGTSNTVSRSYNRGIMTRLSKEVLNREYVYFDWNVSSGDAGGVYNKWDVYNNVVNGLSNRQTNVVLMHDSAQKTYTLDALRDIIRYGKEHGFNFDRITTSTPAVRHNPQN